MLFSNIIVAALAFADFAIAQTPGKTPENHPKLTTYKCTKSGGCKDVNSYVVLEASTHSIHQKNDTSRGCGNPGSGADPSVCPDEKTCAANCIIEGIDKYENYGVNVGGGNMLQLNLLNKDGNAVGPRVYLLAEDGKNYEMLKLLGIEFSFDIDASRLPCGMNGALYLSEMEASGGRQDLNPGGASYGIGYCDAQCSVGPFINGVGNIKGDGVCCNELDLWEANSRATSLAPHTCAKPGVFRCSGDECKAGGQCDPIGCVDNPYRDRNAKDFYGLGLKVDTKKPFTVVTQYPTDGNGVLKAIIRKYVQDGKVIDIPNPNWVMDQAYCDASKGSMYNKFGGHKTTGQALARGMVLAMSVWWDPQNAMHWLDTGLGGPCSETEGFPDEIRKREPSPMVKFSNLKWGEIGSTFSGGNQGLAWKA